MCSGIYGRKKNIINNTSNKGLTDILLKITLPMMIISSFIRYSYSDELVSNMIKVFIYSMVIHLLLILISKILFIKFEKNKSDILKFATIFSNSGFMGFPVLQSALGSLGVLYGSVFNIPFYIFVWTYGISLFTNKNEKNLFKKIFLNPGIICVFIGLIIFLFSIKIPNVLSDSIKLIGDVTTPISMMIIGYMISGVEFKEIFKEKSVYYVSLVRLIIAPTLTYLLLKLIGANSMLINVAIIIEAMPVAAVCAIYAENNDKESSYASLIVFVTTLLSLVTIPSILVLVNRGI